MAYGSRPRELRFALAMNGGVSLAVWIGGVCDELLRLCAAGQRMADEAASFTAEPSKDWPVWQQVCWAANRQPKVDVMTGASAGGMNGVFLALALIYGKQDLGELRKLWIEAGAFERLLRDPLDSPAPSLLKGDAYFLVKLQQAIRELASGNIRPARDVPIDLTLTATSLVGQERNYRDEFGATIVERDHRVTLRFKHRPGDGDAADVSDFVPDTTAEAADVRLARMVNRLARACRSTASFPGAFEPSRVEVADTNDVIASQPLDCLLKRQASFGGVDYLIDGGTLVNLPVEEAIDAVFEQPAATSVRRVLAMVVPDPGGARQPPAAPPAPPALTQVVVSAVSTLPRNQTIGRFLDELDEHNRRVDNARQSRMEVLRRDFPELHAIGRRLFEAYRSSRRGSSGHVVRIHLDQQLKDAKLTADQAEEWREQVGHLDPPWIPASFDGRTDADLVGWGKTTVRRSAARVLHLIAALEPHVQVQQCNVWRDRATQVITEMKDPTFATRDTNLFSAVDLDVPRGGVPAALTALRQHWVEERANVADALTELGQIVEEMRAQGLRLPAVDRCPTEQGVTVLLSLETIENTFAGFGHAVEQRIERIRIDSAASSPIDGGTRSQAAGKVAGLQLGHFGAFVKASWRANDWMWGRLDGSHDLIHLVLQDAPKDRLVALASAHALDPHVDPRAALVHRLRELRHAGIVLEETPSIVDSIDIDRDAGAIVNASARDLERMWSSASADRNGAAFDAGVPSEPDLDLAKRLLRANRIGEETVAEQAGGDLLTKLSVTAFATGTTVVHRASPKVLSAPITALRYVAILAWAIVRSAVGGSAGRAIASIALGVGGALVAVELLDDQSLGSLALIGAALFAAGAVVCFLRAPFVLIPLLALVVTPMLVRRLPEDEPAWWPNDWPYPSNVFHWGPLLAVCVIVSILIIGVARRPWWMQAIRADTERYERRLGVVVGATEEPPTA